MAAAEEEVDGVGIERRRSRDGRVSILAISFVLVDIEALMSWLGEGNGVYCR